MRIEVVYALTYCSVSIAVLFVHIFEICYPCKNVITVQRSPILYTRINALRILMYALPVLINLFIFVISHIILTHRFRV